MSDWRHSRSNKYVSLSRRRRVLPAASATSPHIRFVKTLAGKKRDGRVQQVTAAEPAPEGKLGGNAASDAERVTVAADAAESRRLRRQAQRAGSRCAAWGISRAFRAA